MTNRGIIMWGCALLVSLSLVAPGCGKKEKDYTVSTPGGKVTLKEGVSGQSAMQIETKEGKMAVVTGQQETITEAQLGVPVYPGAKVYASVRMGGTQGKPGMEMHTLTTPDNFEKVANFYKTNLKNVKTNFVQGSAEGGIAMFSIGEESAITVNIGPGNTKGSTAIQVAKKVK